MVEKNAVFSVSFVVYPLVPLTMSSLPPVWNQLVMA
jgi:hypothetical protein